MNLFSEYRIIYIVISFLSALVISYLYYRKTVIRYLYKNILISLRTLSVFLLFSLLIIPYLIFTENTENKPVNIFLIDRSKSMTLGNQNKELENSLYLLNSLGNNTGENHYFTFASDIINEVNEKDLQNSMLTYSDNDNTNLTKTLNTLSNLFGDKKISTVNILSDGIFNEGGNPKYWIHSENTIFNYILTGDTTQKNDLSVKNVFFNPSIYTESNSEIFVEFNSYNYNKDIKIKLYEEEKPVQERIIIVNNNNTDYNCSFNVKSNTEGIVKYKVELENEAGEITDKNNSEEFFINYINNKFRILVISGNPGADFAYLEESIKSNSNFEAQFFVQKTPESFYEGQIPALNSYNLLILNNFPTIFTSLNLVNKINDDLEKTKLPVFFISGSNTDYERLKVLGNHLPINSVIRSANDEKTSLRLINNSNSENSEIFNYKKLPGNLPEIFVPGINFGLNSDSKSILISSKFSRPVLVYSDNNNSAALLCYNFFKWRLNSQNNESKNLLSDILTETTLKIIDKEKNKKISIATEKQSFSPFEQIKINCAINPDENSGNYSVAIQIYNDSLSEEVKANKTSNNNYYGLVRNIKSGEYYIKGTLIQNGTESATDVKKILVKESGLEFKSTKSNNSILNILSSSTGGYPISKVNIEDINKKILEKNNKDMTFYTGINKIYLNSSILILLMFIILISIEWLFRKRINLP